MRRMKQLVLAVLAVALVPCAYAGDRKAESAPTPSAAKAQGEAGMRAYVDPQSGQLVSEPVTDEQKRQATAVDSAFSQDSSDLEVVHLPDGSTMMDLQGRFQQATVASVQSDGRLTTYCNDADHLALGKHRHEADSDAVLTAPAAPANTREER